MKYLNNMNHRHYYNNGSFLQQNLKQQTTSELFEPKSTLKGHDSSQDATKMSYCLIQNHSKLLSYIANK